MKQRIDRLRRKGIAALDPPIQHQNESRCHVPDEEIGWDLAGWPSASMKMFPYVVSDLFRHDLLKMLMNDNASARAHHGCARVPMLMDVFEDRKAETDEALEWFSRRLRFRRRMNRSEHVMDAAGEQLVLVAKMHVESRAAYVGAIQNVLHDYLVVRLFTNERAESLVKEVHRFLNSPILAMSFVHCQISF